MKNIKDFNDFEGQDGYVIVDGTDENTPGGKKLLSTIGGGGGGGGASYTVETISGPFPLNQYDQMLVTLPDNHKVYNITNYNGVASVATVHAGLSHGSCEALYRNLIISGSAVNRGLRAAVKFCRNGIGACIARKLIIG